MSIILWIGINLPICDLTKVPTYTIFIMQLSMFLKDF